jgi:hypothetical protein
MVQTIAYYCSCRYSTDMVLLLSGGYELSAIFMDYTTFSIIIIN